jgi:hypothetical protein
MPGDIVKRMLKREGRGRVPPAGFSPVSFVVGVPRSATTVLRRVCGFVESPSDRQTKRYYEPPGERLDEIETMYRSDGTLLITKAERLSSQCFTAQRPVAARISRRHHETDAGTRAGLCPRGRRSAHKTRIHK